MTAETAVPVLLIAILAVMGIAYLDARSRHDELTRQIDDLATMLGDLLSKEG